MNQTACHMNLITSNRQNTGLQDGAAGPATVMNEPAELLSQMNGSSQLVAGNGTSGIAAAELDSIKPPGHPVEEQSTSDVAAAESGPEDDANACSEEDQEASSACNLLDNAKCLCPNLYSHR